MDINETADAMQDMFKAAKMVMPQMAGLMASMRDNLISEGFTREEAILIIANHKLN